MIVPSRPVEADETGEQIYSRRCASCHGSQGQGVADKYPYRLTKSRSVEQMAALIAKTMPENSPKKCTAAEAARLAEYIHKKLAVDARQGETPRRELARLTVRQYRYTIAELLASFRNPRPWDSRRGLMSSYNSSNDNGDGKHILDRIDLEVNFNFQTASPLPGKMEPRVFAISWSGSVFAPVTGEYEFIVRSENSFRLYVNDRKQPFVDGWIKSGDTREYRSSIRFLGGRAYPLTLHFTKAGQGVRKPNQDKMPIPPASIHLAWRPPGRSEEIIPAKRLSPVEVPETLVVESAFPPDDRSTGFERGTSVTSEWDRATTVGAMEAADFIRVRFGDYTGTGQPSTETKPLIRDFCNRFAERAFRRPLTAEQQALYVARPFESTADLESAVDRVVLMVLKSPRFLYRELGGSRDDAFNAASRLSYVLWDSPPDQELLNAAAAGKLRSREEIAAQARRMVRDPRVDAKLRVFFLQWMKLDLARGFTKNAKSFPQFNATVGAELQTSMELTIEDLLESKEADFRQLLLSSSLFLNGRLAGIYGAKLKAEAPFQKVSFDPNERAGLLSHPYLMAAFADATDSSPIRRGVFVARAILGRTLRPPPDAFVPVPPALHPDLTTRERAILQTKPDSCRSCHALINPLGFTMERYDALGRFRSQDNRRPVDSSGSYVNAKGKETKFNGVRELANFLAESDEVYAAFVDKLFYFSVGHPIRTFGSDLPADLQRYFVEHGFDIRRLMEEIAVRAALNGTG